MYKFSYKHNDEVIFYFDACGNKYIACGGNLAWRINNPGLVRSHCHFAGINGSIGSCSGYAIFANPQQGHQALSDWLHSKKYYNSSLKTVAEHYQPNDSDGFLNKLVSYAQLSADRKIKSLTQQEFNHFLKAIEKCCGYIALGNEKLSLLPKIIAKIDNGNSQEETYLIGSNRILTKAEAIDWITSHQLDGVIVYDRNGRVHLRSRPSHCIWDIRIHEAKLPPSEGQIDTLIRCIGEKRNGQCIWAFINGVSNTKDSALESANLISKAAQGERVFSMPNDSALLGIKDLFVCGALKLTADTPIIAWTVLFFRYLLALSEQEADHPPVIVFVHSQGAIISEHALELLDEKERSKIRIFTFGGGSFIAPGKAHPDSHNYASAGDLVCCLGSPDLQILALQCYFGRKEGLSSEQVIRQLAELDAMLDIDSLDRAVIETYTRQRVMHYKKELERLSNVTILDPDSDSRWKHRFSSNCYQAMVDETVNKYRR